METFSQRIKRQRKECGIIQRELAERVGVSLITVKRWESGERFPRADELKKIAEILHTSPNALMGIDEGIQILTEDETINLRKDTSATSPAEPSLPELPESNARPVKTIKVPFFSGIVKACCGDGNGYLPEDLALELEKQGSFDVPVSELEGYMWQVGPGGFGTIRVEGSSMEPRIHDGDIILYGDLPRSNGNFVLVRYDDRLIVRGIYDDHNGHYTLKALNPAYKDIHVDTEDESKTFFIYGKVIRRISMENLADGMM